MSRPRTKPYVDPFAASEPARRAAAAVLEVMAGMKSPQDVSQALGINVNRYYVLETRALSAMVKALEPLPRGRRRRPEAELARLAREKAKAEREAGRYQALYLLNVRDLASGKVLMSLPCEAETEEVALAVLRLLFEKYGPPIVLKADNGSAFIAKRLRAFVAAYGTTMLYSPPRVPSYNGSCEAGHGSIHTRAHHHAARRGHPEAWTCDDVEAAWLETNATARPWGADGPTPDEAWNDRRPIKPRERDLFREAVARQVAGERSRRGFSPERTLGAAEQASLQRAGISRALAECGYLQFNTRPVSPAIPALISAIFW